MYDMARDLKALWVTYSTEVVYFRVYVRDLVNETDFRLGACYQIQVNGAPPMTTVACFLVFFIARAP